MKIFVFTEFFTPGYKGGGPIKTITNLFEEAGDIVSFSLITSDRDLGDRVPYSDVILGEWTSVRNASVFYSQPGIKRYIQIVRELVRNEYDVVYLNSFFSFRFSIVPFLVAKLFKKPLVLSPRGELSPGALQFKYLKKITFIRVSRLFGLYSNVVFQASSIYEAQEIENVLGNVDVKIAENISARQFAGRLSELSPNLLRIIFLSRISAKKNLLFAIRCLRQVSCNVDFDIYGPIEDPDYWAECVDAIKMLPSNVKVAYKNSLRPDQVIETMASYDLFFMPTKGENYGHVIVEALCAGLPILIADTTPWRCLDERALGWDLALTKPEQFVEIIERISQIDPSEYKQMRENILSWSKERFAGAEALKANLAMFTYAAKINREK